MVAGVLNAVAAVAVDEDMESKKGDDESMDDSNTNGDDASVKSFDSADFSDQSSASSGKIRELIESTRKEVEAGISEYDSIMNDEGAHNKRGRGEIKTRVKKIRKGKKKK